MNIYMPGRTTRSSYRSPESRRPTVIPGAPRRRSGRSVIPPRGPIRRQGNPALDFMPRSELSSIERRHRRLPLTSRRRLFDPASPSDVRDVFRDVFDGGRRKSRRKRRKSRRRKSRRKRRKSRRKRRKSRRKSRKRRR